MRDFEARVRAQQLPHLYEQELFDTEELSGLRSAELSRELREIQKATDQPPRQKKTRAAAMNEDRSTAAPSRAENRPHGGTIRVPGSTLIWARDLSHLELRYEG